MKEKSKKQFTELSDQELEKVTGGRTTLPDNCVPKTSFISNACGGTYCIEKGNLCCTIDGNTGAFGTEEPGN